MLDSGAGVTHVIPIVNNIKKKYFIFFIKNFKSDGYIIGSCIKHIPLAGRDMTNFVA